jgi:hypothetical protein
MPPVYGPGSEGESSGRMERDSAALGDVGGTSDVARSEGKEDVAEWLDLVSCG